jgi:hypothetical protein
MRGASSNGGLSKSMKMERDKDVIRWAYSDLHVRPIRLWRKPGHIPGFLLSHKTIIRIQFALKFFQKFPVNHYRFFRIQLLMVMHSALSPLACLLCAGSLLVSVITVPPVIMRRCYL